LGQKPQGYLAAEKEGAVSGDAFSLPGGTVVTCEQGHEICELKGWLSLGMVFDASSLVEWRPGQEKPPPGIQASACRCSVCGGAWIRPHRAAIALHLKGIGWWPTL